MRLRRSALRRSLLDFKRHPWLHLLSIITITVALFILGIFFMGYRNYQVLTEGESTQVTGTLYLHTALEENEIAQLREHLLGLANIEAAEYKAHDRVMTELAAFMGTKSMDFLPEGKVFPDVFEIGIRPELPSGSLETLKTILLNIPQIAEVDFSKAWGAELRGMSHILKVVGLFLIGGIFIGCCFLIANFMGMRLQAKKKEVDIIRLMGASRRFIMAPFLWEGVMEGVLGGLVALGLLYCFRSLLTSVFSVQWSNLLGFENWVYLSSLQAGGLFLIGVAMALLGSGTLFFRIQERE